MRDKLNDMNQRFVILLVALSLAGTVLGLVMWLGGDAPSPTTNTRRDIALPDSTAPGFESSSGGLETGFEIVGPVAGAAGYYIQQQTKSGQLIEFFGDTLDPLPDGESHVGKPRARVHLAPNRVIEIAADQAEIYAPDNQPRRGILSGNPVLRLYESPPEQTIDYSDNSPHVAIRVKFGAPVRFNLLGGQIDSTGIVTVRHRRFALESQRLRLRYNELTGKIEELSLRGAGWLRLAMGGQQRQSASPTTQPATATQPTQTQPADPVDSGDFYTARFLGLQSIDAGSVNIAGQMLMATFNLAAERGMKGITNAPAQSDASLGQLAQAAGDLNPATLALTSQQQATPLFAPRDDDIVIHWAQALMMRPETDVPQQIQSNTEVLLRLAGAPLQVNIDSAPIARGQRGEYLIEAGRGSFFGGDQHPLRLQWPGEATANGRRVDVDFPAAEARLIGPGVLRATRQPGVLERIESRPVGLGGAGHGMMPAGLSIAFSQMMRLSFDPQTTPSNDPTALGPLRIIGFEGDALATHPTFDLAGHIIQMLLTDGRDQPQRLEQTRAASDVALILRGDQPQGDLALNSQHFQVDWLTSATGRLYPRTLRAREVDSLRQGQMTLQTGQLQVDLTDQRPQTFRPQTPLVSTAPTGGGFATAGDFSVVHNLLDAAKPVVAPIRPKPLIAPGLISDTRIQQARAHDGVHITLANDGVEIHGDQMTSDEIAGQIQILGTPDRPAQVSRADQRLWGRHLVVNQANNTFHVIGPGLALLGLPDDQPEENAAGLTAHWQRGMFVDDRNNTIQLTGQVVLLRDGDDQQVVLQADDLTVQLLDTPGGPKTIGSGTARGNVVTTTHRWTSPARQQLAQRIRITGPVVTFDNLQEQLQVLGAGTMLIEDYGLAPNPDRAVSLGGQGVTLFTWEGQMSLDAAHNDMLMLEQVAMDHAAADGQLVHVDGQRLMADLENTGGLGAWLSDQPKKPQIKGLYADRQVRVITDKRIFLTDSLRYTGANDQVTLHGRNDGQGFVEVREAGNALRADRMIWDLATNTYQIVQPGPMRGSASQLEMLNLTN